MAVGNPSLHRALRSLDRVPWCECGGALCDPVLRPLPETAVRVQRRRAALVLARWLLLIQRARDRPFSAIHAQRREQLPGSARGRVPGVALARARPREVV